MTKLRTYHVVVPVELELEMKTALSPADALVRIIEAFTGDGADPLLGASIRFDPAGPRWIARTRGAKLNGRAYLKDDA